MLIGAAIETHGDQATVTGNKVTDYYRASNIVSSDTKFSGNTVTGAANPVDLWSVVSPGLSNVAVTGNVLNTDIPAWTRVFGSSSEMVSPQATRQVVTEPSSKYPVTNLVVSTNQS